MLVLSRFRGEAITIGDDVEVMVVDVRGDKVRIGVAAPKGVPVHRREIYDAVRKETGSPLVPPKPVRQPKPLQFVEDDEPRPHDRSRIACTVYGSYTVAVDMDAAGNRVAAVWLYFVPFDPDRQITRERFTLEAGAEEAAQRMHRETVETLLQEVAG